MSGCHGDCFIEIVRANLAIYVCCYANVYGSEYTFLSFLRKGIVMLYVTIITDNIFSVFFF